MREPTKWRYYNHALLPDIAPHEKVVFESNHFDSKLWKASWGGVPVIARWTTDFDCGVDTGWWYTILDHPFEISQLKSKRRYVVRKAVKNFEIREVEPLSHVRELHSVFNDAQASYGATGKPVSLESFKRVVEGWDSKIVLAAFARDSGEMAGWLTTIDYGKWATFDSMKSRPSYERLEVNAALVNGLCEYWRERLLEESFYISDGERAILHQTSFQDYLHKYFGFRNAYCVLHVKYRFPLGIVVKALLPFDSAFSAASSLQFARLKGVLRLEKYRRLSEKAANSIVKGQTVSDK